MGRRKIEMKMVLDSGCRQVTFSKRRSGLFKKANELATLCGAEVAVVVFSPGGKPFSFGQPTVDSVASRFLSGDTPAKSKATANGDKVRESAAAERLNQAVNERMRQLHEEKKIGEAIDEDIKGFDLESLGLEELVKLKNSLEDLRAKVKERVCEIEASSTLLMLSNHDDDFVKSQQ